MHNPKFIRVNGHVYRRRNEALHHPRFLRVNGKVYRLVQHVDPEAPRSVVARLTHEEEIELGHRSRAGDIVARNKLVEANIGLVVTIARQLARHDQSKIHDLIQQGHLGLIEAAEKFDPSKGFRFSTYAAYRIKGRIKEFIVQDRNLVSIKQGPEAKIFNNLRRVERELQDQGIDPTDEAVAEVLKEMKGLHNVKPQDVRDMRSRVRGQDGSLYSVSPDGEETTMDVEDHSLRPDRIFEEHEFSARFDEVKDAFAATLKGAEKTLFLKRIVVDKDDNPLTLPEIADKYDVTSEAVRIWEKKLKNKFQIYLNEAFGVGIQLTACLRVANKRRAASLLNPRSFFMQNPKFIQVNGHVYQRSSKAPRHPRFIRVNGNVYRLAQHAELLVSVVNAGENADKLFRALLKLTKNPNVQAGLKKGLSAIQQFNASLASASSPEDYAKCFKDPWSNVNSMLTKYAEAFAKANQIKVSEAIKAATKSLDSSIKALTSAEGLDFIGKELGGEQQESTVDWGEADKPAAKPEPVRASAHPQFIRVSGHLYRAV